MIGVVVMAYGTPRSPDDILPYYTDIRRGRPPTDEQLADLTRRYAAIGGTSPLAARTEAQRAAIQRVLDEISPGTYRVVLGLKHADPKIEVAVEQLADASRIVGLVLAPHFSAFSVGEYLGRMSAAAHVETAGIRSWATEPAFVDLIAADIERRLAAMPSGTHVLFTAHSLPQRILDGGDPYPDELRATAEAVAERAGLEPHRWSIAWQSAGRTPEPWLGPDVLEVIADLDDAWTAGQRGRLRRRPPRGALRPRHRGRRPGRGAPHRVRPHILRQRRPGRDGRTRPPRRRDLLMAHVVVIGGGIAGLTAAHAWPQPPTRSRSRSSRPRPGSAGRSARHRSPASPPSTRVPMRSSPACPGPPSSLGTSVSATVSCHRSAARRRCGGTSCTTSPAA